MRAKLIALTLLLTVFASCAFAQISGRIFDAQNGAPMPFVNVVKVGQQAGTTSDIDGKFTLQDAWIGDQLRFTFVGYQPKTVTIESGETLRVELKATPVELQEATVFPGVNPAEALMQKVIDNKPKNDPEALPSFAYDSYNKLIFTALIDSSLYNNPEAIAALDSSDQQAIDFFEKQHLLMMESVSERRFAGKNKDTEIVKASKVSGLSTPEFAVLGTQLQSFSFYRDEISLLDINFLSPLHDRAVSKYLYVIEDTTYEAADTVFILSYQPRTGKNFDGMKGLLYINSNGYALQNAIAEPAEDDGDFSIRIRQMYHYIDEKMWFPRQLNTDILFKNIVAENFEVVGIGRSYISDVRLNPEFRNRDIGELKLRMDEAAIRQPDELLNLYRGDTLDSKELRTYTFMDSLSKAENWERKLKWLQALGSGYLRWGAIDFDLNHLARFNTYEGFRLGMGVRTNDRFIRNVSFGGYAAYGFIDKAWKGGGDVTFNLRRKSATKLKIGVYEDVFERGGLYFPDQSGLLSPTGYYDLYINRMDRLSVAEAKFSTRLPGFLTLGLAYRNGRLGFSDDYRLATLGGENVTLYDDVVGLQEAEIDLRWSFREVLVQTPSRRFAAGTPFPVVGVRATVGEVEADSGPLEYLRLSASVRHTFKFTMLGDLSVQANAGQLFGEAPGLRWFTLRGTAQQFALAAPMTFETLEPGSTLLDRYAALHIRHNFKDLLFRYKNFRPHFVLVHNMGIGWSDAGNLHHTPETTFYAQDTAPEQGYVESGLEIQNLITSGLTGIGIGGYYRYGAANTGVLQEDLMVKIVLGLNF